MDYLQIAYFAVAIGPLVLVLFTQARHIREIRDQLDRALDLLAQAGDSMRESGELRHFQHQRLAAADKLAYHCTEAIRRNEINSRSAIGGAILQYLLAGEIDNSCDVPEWMERYEREQGCNSEEE